MKQSTLGDAKREKEMAETIWLNYFNRYLFESGTISKKEYTLMTEKISGYHKIRHKLDKAVN